MTFSESDTIGGFVGGSSPLADAIQKIINIHNPPEPYYEIDGKVFTTLDLQEVKPQRDTALSVTVNSLDGVVSMIQSEGSIFKETFPIFVRVSNYDEVKVFTSLDKELDRHIIYAFISDTPQFEFNCFHDYENMIIALRSLFNQDGETAYILDLISKISDENSIATSDNGLSQQVEVKKGVALKDREKIRSRVTLRPYRTFLEVEQPIGTFLLRLREGGQIALFEADGGLWKLTAKRTIAAYLNDKLKDLVEKGAVVVTI
jgi:hypothetical protein